MLESAIIILLKFIVVFPILIYSYDGPFTTDKYDTVLVGLELEDKTFTFQKDLVIQPLGPRVTPFETRTFHLGIRSKKLYDKLMVDVNDEDVFCGLTLDSEFGLSACATMGSNDYGWAPELDMRIHLSDLISRNPTITTKLKTCYETFYKSLFSTAVAADIDTDCAYSPDGQVTKKWVKFRVGADDEWSIPEIMVNPQNGYLKGGFYEAKDNLYIQVNVKGSIRQYINLLRSDLNEMKWTVDVTDYLYDHAMDRINRFLEAKYIDDLEKMTKKKYDQIDDFDLLFTDVKKQSIDPYTKDILFVICHLVVSGTFVAPGNSGTYKDQVNIYPKVVTKHLIASSKAHKYLDLFFDNLPADPINLLDTYSDIIDPVELVRLKRTANYKTTYTTHKNDMNIFSSCNYVDRMKTSKTTTISFFAPFEFLIEIRRVKDIANKLMLTRTIKFPSPKDAVTTTLKFNMNNNKFFKQLSEVLAS